MYKHTQIGWPIVIVLGGVFLLFAALAIILPIARGVGPLAGFFVAIAIVLAMLILFGSLTVSVDNEWVQARFGPGLIGKDFRLSDIAACEPVRNRWYYGWGIRWIPGGCWLFNISGLDAVELRMKNGRRYRVGTDEPQKLSESIQGKLNPVPVVTAASEIAG
jgi:hypothetical protein